MSLSSGPSQRGTLAAIAGEACESLERSKEHLFWVGHSSFLQGTIVKYLGSVSPEPFPRTHHFSNSAAIPNYFLQKPQEIWRFSIVETVSALEIEGHC